MPRNAGIGFRRKKRQPTAVTSNAVPTPKKRKTDTGDSKVAFISPPRSTKHGLPTPARKLVNFFCGLLSFNDNDMRKTISIVLNRLEESIQDNGETSASALDVINLVDDEEQADEEQPQKRPATNEFISPVNNHCFKHQKNRDRERTSVAARVKKSRDQ